MRLFLGNLPYEIRSEDLSAWFGSHGYTVIAQVITDRMSGRSKGFGFVELAEEEGLRAVQQLNNTELLGRPITVNVARPMTERSLRPLSPKLFGDTGGFEAWLSELREQTPPAASIVVVPLDWKALILDLAVNFNDIDQLEPGQLEELVTELLRLSGYSAERTSYVRDKGLDVVASKGDFAVDLIIGVQVKHYSPHVKVGSPAMQGLIGAVVQHGATSGLMVTTSAATGPAHEVAQASHIPVLIRERHDLASWISAIAQMRG